MTAQSRRKSTSLPPLIAQRSPAFPRRSSGRGQQPNNSRSFQPCPAARSAQFSLARRNVWQSLRIDATGAQELPLELDGFRGERFHQSNEEGCARSIAPRASRSNRDGARVMSSITPCSQKRSANMLSHLRQATRFQAGAVCSATQTQRCEGED
jgi:hypothetical protein